MRFSTIQLVKVIEENIDVIMTLFLESEVDEDGSYYKDVYQYEVSTFLEGIECEIEGLMEAGILISYVEIRNAIINHWFCGVEDSLDMKRLNELSVEFHNQSLFIEKEPLILSHELTAGELEFIKKTLRDNVNKDRDLLVELHLNEDSPLRALKKIDEAKYQSVVKRLIEDYVNGVNALYKLYGDNPNNWETSRTLHRAIVKHYNIPLSSFKFE